MTRQSAKDKAKRMFTGKGESTLACVLVNSIYDDFETSLDNECKNKEHDFTVSTKELCSILEHLKKTMVQ